MALKPVIDVKCPCCKSILEIDVARERVVAHRKGAHLKEDAREGEDGLDVALREAQRRKAELEDRFHSARRELDRSSDRLDRLFKEAQKRALEDEDDEPDNPFKQGKIWD